MFKPVEKADLNQISLTGMRSIVIIGLLMMKPLTLEEIRDALIDLKIFDKSNSNDILRIDLNTIKAMGCKIGRASSKTNYKYILEKHPFTLKLSDEDIRVLKRAYKFIKPRCDIDMLFEYDRLFRKINTFIDDEDTREAILGISVFKHYEQDFLLRLMADCEREAVVTLTYSNPTTKKDTVKEILAQKLVYQNDKIYLYGYDINKKRAVTLNLKRITSLLGKKFLKHVIETEKIDIKFFINNDAIKSLEKNEQIIETQQNGCIVIGSYHNEFIAKQRMLSFGYHCVVLEPLEFRQEIINKLKEMRDIYDR